MKILAVECTASPVSAALADNGKILGEYFLNQKTTHSQTLMPMIDSLLKLCSLNPNDIDAFAVPVGPGSFTGVRIGVSAVKGLAEPINKPCIPVSVLEAMAYNMEAIDCIVCAVMDARCNQFYNALFKIESGKIERLCEDRAILKDDLIKEVALLECGSLPIFAVGDGADIFYEAAKDKLDNLKLTPEHLKYQRATGVYKVAENSETFVSAEDLLPTYLRLPQAERELKAKSLASERK